MWDARTYCSECVESSCSNLFPFAQTHAAFEERIEIAVLNSLRPRLRWWIRMIAPPVIFLTIGIGMAIAGMVWLAVVSIVGGLLSAIAKYFMWANVRSLIAPNVSEPLMVSAADGCVEVRRGGNLVVTAPLADWSWWHGNSHFPEIRAVPIQRLVVLTAPKGSPERHFVCGCTTEMRDRWIGFLKLAGVKRT
jgi:hypothetical protein